MIDCDVHQNFSRLRDLLPWIDPGHRDFVLHAGFGGFELPNYLTWMHPQGTTRRDAVPPDGGVPGSDYETIRKQLLDPLDVEYAILTGEDILSVSSLPNPQVAAAIATAYNRWLIDEWLPRDSRLKGSLVVATQDATRAAEEIRAFGDHPDIVQVLLPCAATSGYGNRQYHPIYEAAVEVGLPVAMHVGGEGLGINPPPTATGYPIYYIEWHVLLVQCAMSHVVSLVSHGVFEKYPELRGVVIEAGVTWLPPLLWRMDADWKSLRSEVPWVKRPPSEVVREHMRFTTQPLDETDGRQKVRQALELVDGLEDMLMFATDYPHWDFDRPDLVGHRLPASWREKVMSENARTLYGLTARPIEATVTGQEPTT
ncbi:MAG: amidohydrolase [Actinomycetota bacterium]|nr:amidohydrolase [Actinomycetota bacterium]